MPPSPYPKLINPDKFWLGTDKLWTALPANGTWKLGHYTPADPSFRQKLFWWRRGYDGRAGSTRQLNVTGRRLDAEAAQLTADLTAGWTNDRKIPFMVTGINIPTVGCWQINGDYTGDKLTFIIRIRPSD